MILKDFQKTAVDTLCREFLTLWNTDNYQLPLVFKAPTGSGKTIMMAEFLRTIDSNYHFNDDKAYIWISFGGDDSYMQSKDKLYKYFNDGTDMGLKDYNDLSQKRLSKNNVFFINWAKIKGTEKEGKLLRKDSEITIGNHGIFDEYIKNTKKERELILIIDEAHSETDTLLADEIINLINPRVIIKVTATPKSTPSADDIADNKAGYVRVEESDVIDSGLIKDNIIIQTEEEINLLATSELSEDELMIELAIQRRDDLKKHYEILGLDINPLVLIQLPSDMNDKEQVVSNKKIVVLNYLKNKKDVHDDEIAIWLSGSNNKINLKNIELNNNEVNFMLFKVAPATGWDCPRASILVMFREIKTPTFHTQIIGRIKRMPEAKHYDNGILNKAYIYTNYNKSHIKKIKDEPGNKTPIHTSTLKEDVKQIELNSVYHNRVDFNTLSPEPKWQSYMLKILDENKKNIQNNIELNITNISNKIIVDTEINSFDNFMLQLKTKANETDFNFSKYDIEKLYNLLCFEELEKQDIELAKYNPSRSWSALKKSLNVWFSKRLELSKDEYYTIIVNDLLKDNDKSILKPMIHSALKGFRELYEITLKDKDGKEALTVSIPPLQISFTDDYELISSSKNIYDEFYNHKNYRGKINEEKFIKFLDGRANVSWWHKQGDSGKDNFAIEYFDTQEKKDRLFFPDFIIKTNDNKLYIVDTKKDATAKSTETKNKAEALQKWIKENQEDYDFTIIGGIVIFKHPCWLLNNNDNYIYENNDWIDIF